MDAHQRDADLAHPLNVRCTLTRCVRVQGTEERKRDGVLREAILQEALADPFSAGGDNSQVRVAVYKMHTRQLMQFVFVRVLDDTQAVHPEVLESEGVRNIDRVANGLGQARDVDALGIEGYVGSRGPVRLGLAPHIAECEVFAMSAPRCDQAGAAKVSAVDQARGERDVGRRRDLDAALVSVHTLANERVCERERTGGSDV